MLHGIWQNAGNATRKQNGHYQSEKKIASLHGYVFGDYILSNIISASSTYISGYFPVSSFYAGEGTSALAPFSGLSSSYPEKYTLKDLVIGSVTYADGVEITNDDIGQAVGTRSYFNSFYSLLPYAFLDDFDADGKTTGCITAIPGSNIVGNSTAWNYKYGQYIFNDNYVTGTNTTAILPFGVVDHTSDKGTEYYLTPGRHSYAMTKAQGERIFTSGNIDIIQTTEKLNDTTYLSYITFDGDFTDVELCTYGDKNNKKYIVPLYLPVYQYRHTSAGVSATGIDIGSSAAVGTGGFISFNRTIPTGFTFTPTGTYSGSSYAFNNTTIKYKATKWETI